MKASHVALVPLTQEDREQFILDNQAAFRYGAMAEFGSTDGQEEEPGEIISRATIEESIDGEGCEAWRIMHEGNAAGGMVLKLDRTTGCNELLLLFIDPKFQSLGIGQAAWREAEKLHPETKVWETCTPYFDKRNLHFYINKCGFHAVELFGPYHPDPHETEQSPDGAAFLMFRFEKVMAH